MVVKRSIRRYFELMKLYAQMDLGWLLRDTLFAVLALSADVVGTVSSISGLFLLSWRLGGIGEWQREHILFMLGFATLVSGLFQLFFTGNNTGHFSRRIGRGQVEHMWIQPLSFPMQLMTEGFLPFTASGNVISGTLITVIAIQRLSIDVSFAWTLQFVGLLLLSLVTVVAISYLVSALAFYSPVQAEEISTYVLDSLRHLRNFPLNAMPKSLQVTLLSVIPAGMIAWYPTTLLLNTSQPSWRMSIPLIYSAVLSMLALTAIRKGLRYYVQTGIHRYLVHGHRR